MILQDQSPRQGKNRPQNHSLTESPWLAKTTSLLRRKATLQSHLQAGLLSILDKNGTEFVFQETTEGIFSINGSIKDAESKEISSSTATEITHHIGPWGPDGREALIMTYAGLQSSGVLFTCAITITPDQEGLEFWMDMEGNTDGLENIRYPVIKLTKSLGGSGEDDVMMTPHLNGIITKNPASVYDETGKSIIRAGKYPLYNSMQFLSFYDDRSGLYAATHDNAGMFKQFKFRYQQDYFDLDIFHLFDSHEEKRINYPTVLRLFRDGDWKKAANQYRRWAHKQWWCEKTLSERNDVPSWMKDGFFSLTAFDHAIKGDQRTHHFNSWLPNVEAIRDRIPDAPGLFYIIRSERLGPWNSHYAYPPAMGKENLRTISQELRARNLYPVITFDKPLAWEISLTDEYREHYRIGPDSAEEDFRDKSFTAKTRKGAPVIREYEEGNKTHQKGMLCSAASGTREYFRTMSKGLAENGITGIQFDPGPDFLGAACYDSDHGHPLGLGKYQFDALYKMYKKVRLGLGPNGEDLPVTKEYPHEAPYPRSAIGRGTQLAPE